MPWQVEPAQHACVKPVLLLRHHLSGHESAAAKASKEDTTAKRMNFMVLGLFCSPATPRRSALALVAKKRVELTSSLLGSRLGYSPGHSASSFYTIQPSQFLFSAVSFFYPLQWPGLLKECDCGERTSGNLNCSKISRVAEPTSRGVAFVMLYMPVLAHDLLNSQSNLPSRAGLGG